MWPSLTFGLLKALVLTGWDCLEEAWHPELGVGLLGLLTMMGDSPRSLWDAWNMSRVKECLALGSPCGSQKAPHQKPQRWKGYSGGCDLVSGPWRVKWILTSSTELPRKGASDWDYEGPVTGLLICLARGF